MLPKETFKKAYEEGYWEILEGYYDETNDLLKEILKYEEVAHPENIYLINKLKNYLNGK